MDPLEDPHKITKSPFLARLELRYRTIAYANDHRGWRAKHASHKADKEALRLAWLAAGRPTPTAYPADVTFTRVAPQRLDSDNLVSAFKFFRDELCRCFGLLNDSGPEIRWHYGQVLPKAAGKPQGSYWVMIDIESDDGVRM